MRDLGSDRLFGFVFGAVFVSALILNAMAYWRVQAKGTLSCR
jgi:hypothetical protein